MQKIIDTHCHYNLEPLVLDVAKHWQDSLSDAVVGAVCVGTNLETSTKALNLAQSYDALFATIGIHPGEYTEKIKSLLHGDQYSQSKLDETITQDIQELSALLTYNLDPTKKLIAIGEIGLDYFKLRSKGLKRELVLSLQKQAFKKQLELAFEHELPVILHVRDQAQRYELSQQNTSNAYFEVYEIVSNLVSKYTKNEKKVPVLILHCASGPKEYIQNFLDLGAYIGVAGNATYANATEIGEIISMTPPQKILLETDAPYLAPLQHKGQTCEPRFIKMTATFLEQSFGINLDIIINNTLKVFPQFSAVIQEK